jgi:alanine racemase
MQRNTTVEVNLGILAENIRRVQSVLGPDTKLMFVVKANAYGHGMVPVARKAAEAGVSWFVVAHVFEALELRRAIPEADVLVIGAIRPSDARAMVEHNMAAVVVDESHGVALAGAARQAGRPLAVHLKIDTGMGRLGIPWELADAVHARLAALSDLDVQGICTHFASVEVRKPSLGVTQLDRFQRAAGAIEGRAGRRLFRHVSSSRALQYFADWDLDGVRPGIILYGYGSGERNMRAQTRPILQWRSHVAQVKRVPAGFTVGYYSTHVTPLPTTIATVAAGYADGYHRSLGNKGVVLIRGRRRPVVGRISMNWITVDCGPDSDVAAGDEVTLVGEQGGEQVWADELARLARTIPYEILTSIHASADRVYLNG